MERRSVMARTADIQVNANRGRTTQELHREALSENKETEGEGQRRGKKEKEQGVQSQTRQANKSRHDSTLSLPPSLTGVHTHTHKSIRDSVVGNLKLIGTQRFVVDLIF